MVLLDTDVVIDLLRQYPPALDWLDTLGDQEVALPGYVAMELLQGCRDLTEQRRLQKALEPFAVLWPPPDICDAALAVFAQNHLSLNLGLLDALIGQLAVSMNSPLHTFNQKHYAAFSELETVQPYRKL